MTVRKKGARWLADFMVGGHRYREPFTTFDQAEQWEEDVRRALKRGDTLPSPKNGRRNGRDLSTLGGLFTHVKLSHWRGLRSARTLTMNADAVVKYLGRDRMVRDITRADLDDAVIHFRELGNSNGTINRKMSGISKMLRIAFEAGVIKVMPVIPKSKEGVGRTRFLTEHEEDALLALWTFWGQEDIYHFTVMALDTGGRLSEVIGLKWNGGVNPDYANVTFWETKTDMPRTIPLTARAKASLRAMRSMNPDAAGPFSHLTRHGKLRTMWDRMRNHLPDFEDVVIHSLRHTCASRLVQRGVDLRRVQKWMGHKAIETTLRYAQLATTDLDVLVSVLEQSVVDRSPVKLIVGGDVT